MSERCRRLALVAAVMSTVLVVSCADERACGPDQCRQPACPPSVEELLVRFAVAWETNDLDAYSRCLDDTYTFEFAEDDWESVGVNAEIPYWTRVADLEAMDSLFNSAFLENIGFAWNIFVSADIGPDTARMVARPDVQVTVDKGYTEPVTFWINSSWLEVSLRRSPATSCWTITKIKETLEPPGPGAPERCPAAAAAGTSAAVESISLGRVKWTARMGRFST